MRPSTRPPQLLAGLAVLAGSFHATAAWADAAIGSGWAFECFKPANAVASFAQDSTGAVWIGSQNGLMRIEGTQNASFYVGTTITPSSGLRVAIESNDDLWVAMGLGFLRPALDGARLEIAEPGHPDVVRISGGKQVRFGTAAGLPEAHVWAVHIARDGALWAGTEHGIARFRDGRFVVPAAPEALPGSHVLAIASDAAQQIWIGTTQGLARLNSDRVETAWSGRATRALAVDDGRGLVWAATLSGVVGLRGLRAERTLTVDDGLPANAAQALLVDRRDNLWVGTARGLARFAPGDPARPEIFRNSHGLGLPDNEIHSLFEDREGNIWVGTRVGGICRIAPKTVWDLDTANGLEAETAFSIVRAHDDTMWVSTAGQIARFREGKLLQRWQPGLANGAELRALTEAPDGGIWVTTTGPALVHLPGGTGTPAPELVALPPAQFASGARTIVFDHQGAVWLGRTGGGLLRAPVADVVAKTGTWDMVGGDRGVCTGEVTAAMASRDHQSLWFGTDGGGATRWDGTAGRCFTEKDGLATNKVTSFFEDAADGAIWIGMRNDAGLARYRAGRISRVRGDQGLYCDSIAGLAADAEQGLWTMCGNGGGRSRLSDLNAVAAGKSPFALTLGFSSSRSRETTVGTNPAGAVDPEGRLWWATLGGVTVIERPRGAAPPVARLPKISGVDIGGMPTPVASELLVRAVESNVLFRFSTPSFLPATRTVFRHRLEGIDQDWRHHFETEARYEHLPAGQYRLRLGISDGFGGWSPRETTLALLIKPPFHRTVTFWLAVVLGVSALVFGAVKVRERTLRARYATIAAERTRIARDLHDVIGQAFASIGLLLDAIRTTKASMPEPTREIAERAREVLDHCHGDIRTAIWELRQPGGAETSLAALATQVIDEMRRSTGDTGPKIALRAPAGSARVPELVRHELPHVLREALSNAVKHSGARTIDVALTQDAAGVLLTVEDDGRGLAVDEQAMAAGGHLGVLGMRERARRMAAQLSFAPRAGGGTVVRLHAPLETRDDTETLS